MIYSSDMSSMFSMEAVKADEKDGVEYGGGGRP